MTPHTAMDTLIPWLLRQVTMDETQARAMPHAIAHLEARWNPAHLLARSTAIRQVVRMYERAIAAYRTPSASDRNRTQDEAAADVLAEAVKELAVPYAHLAGYQECWRPESWLGVKS